MSKINDGGSAFARPHSERQGTRDGTQIHSAQQGMSLRDYFAAHAPEVPDDFCWIKLETDGYQRLTRWRYHYADAMLAAREVAK